MSLSINGLVLLLLTISYQVQFLRTSGVLQIRLETYRNPDKSLADRSCCIKGTSDCRIDCSNSFKVCISNIKSPNTCNLANITVIGGDIGDDELFDADGSETRFQNPIMFNLPNGWNEDQLSVTFKVFHATYNLVGIFKPVTIDIDGAEVQWKSIGELKTGSRRKYKYLTASTKTQCDVGYLGSFCDERKCIPQDDNNGHYTCSKDNRIVCLPGWTNEIKGCIKEIVTSSKTSSITLQLSTITSSSSSLKELPSTTITPPSSSSKESSTSPTITPSSSSSKESSTSTVLTHSLSTSVTPSTSKNIQISPSSSISKILTNPSIKASTSITQSSALIVASSSSKESSLVYRTSTIAIVRLRTSAIYIIQSEASTKLYASKSVEIVPSETPVEPQITQGESRPTEPAKIETTTTTTTTQTTATVKPGMSTAVKTLLVVGIFLGSVLIAWIFVLIFLRKRCKAKLKIHSIMQGTESYIVQNGDIVTEFTKPVIGSFQMPVRTQNFIETKLTEPVEKP